MKRRNPHQYRSISEIPTTNTMMDMENQAVSIQNDTLPDCSSLASTSHENVMAYAKQAGKLSHTVQDVAGTNSEGAAIRAEWITPQDPVIITAGGDRLPGVPLKEAVKLNTLRERIGGGQEEGTIMNGYTHMAQDNDNNNEESSSEEENQASPKEKEASVQKSGDGSLRRAMPPARTNPLFPPLPLYGPSSFRRDMQCYMFRFTSFFLSLAFLGTIVIGAIFRGLPIFIRRCLYRFTFRDPDRRRPFYKQEQSQAKLRKEQDAAWKRRSARRKSETPKTTDTEVDAAEEFVPTEGGKDLLVTDVGYYARRVGLDVEFLKVQTEDGFLIDLWHVYDPREYVPMTEEQRRHRGPEAFVGAGASRYANSNSHDTGKKPKYPVLLIHGLLQSSGAYCCTDEASLAFYLCKSGYDVWLGNNRCGGAPEHTLLSYSDPRMWAWNIRQMGVMDLPALMSRVLSETRFEKLGLICHSQGTTQTFVALAKDQRPDLGPKISIFCALAPAVYAGPLLGKLYLKFMKLISPAVFRIFFGIHSFIPLMMTAQHIVPGRLFGILGYLVFSYLFGWTDTRWDKGLRDRCFLFAPTYISAESMRWWLGRDSFAKQRCILSSREENDAEEEEDKMRDYYKKSQKMINDGHDRAENGLHDDKEMHETEPKVGEAWFDERAPPMAFWVAGGDDLVDGRRLLRRFNRGREPYVDVVHQKVIEHYEHLDVLWAINSIEEVGEEVKECLWRTCDDRERCRVPRGCEDVPPWTPSKTPEHGDNPESPRNG